LRTEQRGDWGTGLRKLGEVIERGEELAV
jgi:hypothetical protein